MFNKVTTRLLAGTAGLGLIFGLAGCAGSATPEPGPDSSNNSSNETEAPTEANAEQQAAADAYETFLNNVLAISPEDVTAVFTELETEFATDPTQWDDETKNRVLERFVQVSPEAYNAIRLPEGTSLDDQASAYGAVSGTAIAWADTELTVDVPASAVTVEGDSATIDRTEIKVEIIEATSEEISVNPPESRTGNVGLTLIDGQWYVSSLDGFLSELGVVYSGLEE